MNPTQIKALKNAMADCIRFVLAGKAALANQREEVQFFGKAPSKSAEAAAAKRASMEASRSLSRYRATRAGCRGGE